MVKKRKRSTKTKKRKPGKRKRVQSTSAKPSVKNNGLNTLFYLSPEMASFLGMPTRARKDLTKDIWSYVDRHNLKQSSTILCDAPLRSLFGVDKIDFLTLQSHLSKHLLFPVSKASQLTETCAQFTSTPTHELHSVNCQQSQRSTKTVFSDYDPRFEEQHQRRKSFKCTATSCASSTLPSMSHLPGPVNPYINCSSSDPVWMAPLSPKSTANAQPICGLSGFSENQSQAPAMEKLAQSSAAFQRGKLLMSWPDTSQLHHPTDNSSHLDSSSVPSTLTTAFQFFGITSSATSLPEKTLEGLETDSGTQDVSVGCMLPNSRTCCKPSLPAAAAANLPHSHSTTCSGDAPRSWSSTSQSLSPNATLFLPSRNVRLLSASTSSASHETGQSTHKTNANACTDILLQQPINRRPANRLAESNVYRCQRKTEASDSEDILLDQTTLASLTSASQQPRKVYQVTEQTNCSRPKMSSRKRFCQEAELPASSSKHHSALVSPKSLEKRASLTQSSSLVEPTESTAMLEFISIRAESARLRIGCCPLEKEQSVVVELHVEEASLVRLSHWEWTLYQVHAFIITKAASGVPRFSTSLEINQLKPEYRYRFSLVLQRSEMASATRVPDGWRKSVVLRKKTLLPSSDRGPSNTFQKNLNPSKLSEPGLFYDGPRDVAASNPSEHLLLTEHLILVPRNDVASWTHEDVICFAQLLNIPLFVERCKECRVLGAELVSLCEKDLVALGITAPFLIRRILTSITHFSRISNSPRTVSSS